MKGSIRIIVGFLIAYGAVGTMDYDPNADVLVQTAIAFAGLGVMWFGVRAMGKQNGSY
jgi:hypothetical protein